MGLLRKFKDKRRKPDKDIEKKLPNVCDKKSFKCLDYLIAKN